MFARLISRSSTAAGHFLPCGTIGSITTTLTMPRRGNQESDLSIERVPCIDMGITGVFVAAAEVNAPIRKGNIPGLRVKVPSGKKSNDRPDNMDCSACFAPAIPCS